MGKAQVSRAVLITGCSTGIGRATAERLAKRGHRVYATARRLEAVEDLKAAGCETLRLDVTDEASMVEAVEAVVAAEGAVGALVNNAGYSQGGAVESLDIDAVRRQFETNVFGAIRLVQLCLPGMRDQGWGRIVNVSSMGGRFTLPGGGAYHASKHALEAFSDALRWEVAGFGVGVSIVEPGIVLTDFPNAHAEAVDSHTDGGPYEAFNTAVRTRVDSAYTGPLAKLGTGPEKIARVIERAVTSSRPKTRYRVGVDARSILLVRRSLPDRVFDTFLRSQYPRPSA
ncbi:MAG TPA: oxidoreductase [Acidimicrobiia bacterium]|nr:oxidoreductase [Acidimicrobiia bacterium]